MPKYKVTIKITRTIDCYGRDEDAAMEKACEIVRGWKDVNDIVRGWKDVNDVDAVDAEEIYD